MPNEKQNLNCYFDKNFRYVEEFDTSDGSHHILKVNVEDWTQEIYEEAVRCGFVNQCIQMS